MANKVKTGWGEEWEELKEENRPTKSKRYYFSNFGRLKSVDKETGDERRIGGSFTIRGYHQINITFKDNSRKGYYVQKLVAERFCEKEHDGQCFLVHIDGNLKNNHYQNLKWVDQKEMTAFQIEKGIYKPQNRKRNSAYKMTPSKVKMLKKMLKEGKTKKKIIARKFHITPEQLRKIEKGIDWAWVTIEGED